ncbi:MULTISPECIES: ricin-type beta-trefoil lectin domain protein [unclassified Streptomyces]|uniref:ricin-type beta-trefoil lectin domain protein n=1 Tax=unclassified Streptomyces TaxID=2593676 RepID=UPI0023655117|nr:MULTISPECIES: ricin-type beta-trefoil lectin domain protein [unclassified Streptomyces]MDF3143717.1 ricin-type beta-trefoil lectin domain protein [Streptomyces sp. T21Q-yed]WDF38865.1 ricin-type beta-trefoil lectin domain protein [Streptomyces sp. T12]
MHLRSRFRTVGAQITALTLAATGGMAVLATPAHAADTVIGVTLTTSDLSQALTPQPGITLGPVSLGAVNLTVDDSKTFQTIDGFGASFTDTSTYLLQNKLDAATRDRVMRDLFSRGSGIGLSLMRVPMGSSDYTATPPSSPGTYSYDDNGGVADPNLTNFSTAHDDAYVIPVIKQAQALNPQMKLFANNWSPPAWMKTTNTMLGAGNGTLKADMYGPLANYYVKFLQEYKAKGVKVWGVTPQNEPTISPPSYSAMLWPAADEARFIADHLAPALKQAGLDDTKILGADADHVNVNYANTLMANQAARDATYGTAWHCYRNDLRNMTTIHNSYPDKRLYESECSTGPGIAPMNAAQLTLESTFNWANGVLLWNLALDTNGGPKMGVGCEKCTGLVTIDQATGKPTYTDNYYQLGQFSKFVVPGATRIGYSDGGNVWAQAYKNPDGSEVLVAHNNNSSATTFTTTWNGDGSFQYTLPAGATVTFTKSAQNGAAQLVGQGSNRCLDDRGNPANGVQQYIWDCGSGNTNQSYLYSADRELRIAGKCLGASGNGTANGTKVITWDCNGHTSQKWTFHADGSVTNDQSGLCLDVTGHGTANGSPVQLWSCTGNPNQKWSATAPG